VQNENGLLEGHGDKRQRGSIFGQLVPTVQVVGSPLFTSLACLPVGMASLRTKLIANTTPHHAAMRTHKCLPQYDWVHERKPLHGAAGSASAFDGGAGGPVSCEPVSGGAITPSGSPTPGSTVAVCVVRVTCEPSVAHPCSIAARATATTNLRALILGRAPTLAGRHL
jgi:hypothetical protein